jgi:predicted metal-dependent phosphoesterase TrpH
MRDERNAKLVARLAYLRKPVELEEALALSGGQVLGRPHFARAMVERGYVSTIEEAFVRYLGRGGSAHIPKERLSRRDAVELIRAAGGVPVLAHPNQTQLEGADLERMVRELKDFGLIGLETRYSGYTKKQCRRFRRIAQDNGLLESGGSDFHGSIKPGISLGIGSGTLHVPDEILPVLREAAQEVRSGRR